MELQSPSESKEFIKWHLPALLVIFLVCLLHFKRQFKYVFMNNPFYCGIS